MKVVSIGLFLLLGASVQAEKSFLRNSVDRLFGRQLQDCGAQQFEYNECVQAAPSCGVECLVQACGDYDSSCCSTCSTDGAALDECCSGGSNPAPTPDDSDPPPPPAGSGGDEDCDDERLEYFECFESTVTCLQTCGLPSTETCVEADTYDFSCCSPCEDKGNTYASCCSGGDPPPPPTSNPPPPPPPPTTSGGDEDCDDERLEYFECFESTVTCLQTCGLPSTETCVEADTYDFSCCSPCEDKGNTYASCCSGDSNPTPEPPTGTPPTDAPPTPEPPTDAPPTPEPGPDPTPSPPEPTPFPPTTEEACPVLGCCMDDCCGPQTKWDTALKYCVADASSPGWDGTYTDPDYSFECVERTCCEADCCFSGTIYDDSIKCCVPASAPTTPAATDPPTDTPPAPTNAPPAPTPQSSGGTSDCPDGTGCDICPNGTIVDDSKIVSIISPLDNNPRTDNCAEWFATVCLAAENLCADYQSLLADCCA